MIPGLDIIVASAVRTVVAKAIDYGYENRENIKNSIVGVGNYVKNKYNENFSDDDDIEYKRIKKIFDIINCEPTILNYTKDEYCAKIIKSKLIEKYSEYDEIDLDYFEGFISGVRNVVKIRRTIFDILKYNPTMIKKSDSTIKNEIYDNFEVDDDFEEYLSQEIERVKIIFKLYKKGKNLKEIYEETLVFEFEIAQFMKNFNRMN